MTTIMTEAVYESWYERTLKPDLERALGLGKVRVAKRDLKGFVQVEIRCADEEELMAVEDVLEELEGVRFEEVAQ